MTPEYHHVDIPDSPVPVGMDPHLPLLKKPEIAAPPQPTSTRLMPRKPWMILILPLAIAMAFTAGMCCLSTAEIKSALQSLEHLTVASASWPNVPLTFEDQTSPQQQLQQQHQQQPAFSVQRVHEAVDQKESTQSSRFVEDGCWDEEEEDDDEEEYDDDDEDNDNENDKDDEEPAEPFQALEIIKIENGLVEVIVVEEEPVSVQNLVQPTAANDPVSNLVTLSRRRNQYGNQEDESEDEDRHDHFPLNMNDEDEISGQEGKEPKDKEHNHSHRNNDHLDQNTNLGGTGGNGPILLCSSHLCLPSLRDSILAKLSVQIRHVMDHLRNGPVLVQRMDTTLPLTKDILVSSQTELVEQLEKQIIKDLRDWVMGGHKHSTVGAFSVGANKSRKKDKLSSNGLPSTKTYPPNNKDLKSFDNHEDEAGPIEEMADVSVEAEEAFLGGEEEDVFDSTISTGEDQDFSMAGLDLSDEDDDDEDHEDDFVTTTTTTATTQKQYKTSSKKKHFQRRAEAGSRREYFLSADKLLMQQEWSRWIAHWVHHAKLMILSHTLATKTLNTMNQVAITDDNVPTVDQRHWSWNLDKALATVMVASEMLCGGPTDPKDADEFLLTLSMPVSASSSSSKTTTTTEVTPRIMTLTVNAQKCIEAWRADLEEILRKTATTTA
ncbi:hypothetical protein CPC16_011564 [Podila verticillata]|nr:hypothetical protein CPC16_011564 [Podila verticillata]